MFLLLDDLINDLNQMTYFNRISLDEVLEEDIFFNYEHYSILLEDSEWS